MKYLKYVIIFIIVIIIILVICIMNISNNTNENSTNNVNMASNNSNTLNNNKINNITSNSNETTDYSNQIIYDGEIIDGKQKQLKDENMFFTIEKCVQNYINNITNRNNTAIYNQLSLNYITTNNINTSNVLNYVENISGTQEFRAIKMNYVQGDSCTQYGIYGKLLTSTGNTSEIYLILNLNSGNLRYSIIPQLGKNYTNLSQVNINVSNEQIPENENNQGNYVRITDEQHIKNIIKDYQKNALYDTENAYKSLDEEYSKKRFANYSDYFNYVTNNAQKIQDLTLINYKKEQKGNYIQYNCTDNYGNVYTTELTGIMEYTIILDNYTLQTTSDINSYNNSTNKQKVENNVKKVISMVNTCDYNHLYNLLYDGFKSNYFATQKDMEEIIKQKFFNYNIISAIEVNESENGVYICVVELKDRSAVAANTVTRTIIMQLGEGTNFEMSFDI